MKTTIVAATRRLGEPGLRKVIQATLAFTAFALMAGCASTPAGLRMSDLRDPVYFRGERILPGNFPTLQMALFKHEQACGYAPKFALDKDQTSYATIIDMREPSSSYEHAVMIDLIQYKPNYLADDRVKAKAYSYYADAATLRRIDVVYQAMLNPEVCPQDRAAD